MQDDFQSGQRLLQFTHRLRQYLHGERRRIADVDLCVAATRKRTYRLYRIVSPIEDGAHLAVENPAGIRETDSLGAALKKPDAEFILQIANLPAQRRLRHVELLSRPGDILRLGDGDEIAKMTKLHCGFRAYSKGITSQATWYFRFSRKPAMVLS